MTPSKVPLGEVESQRLEFKSAKELESLARSKSDLGRSVAAMLNAEGGDIWIGLMERNGRAEEIESIANSAAAVDSVWNHMLSTIDPPLAPDEIKIEEVSSGAAKVLRIEVASGTRKPYAFRRQGQRYYIRIGSRVRDMTREELVRAMGEASQAQASALERARELLDARRTQLERKGDPTFWVGLVAVWTGGASGSLEFDLATIEAARLLTDPRATGSRPGSVLATERLEPKRRDRSISIGQENWGFVVVENRGVVEQKFPLHRLWDRGLPDGSGEQRRLIQPIALIENLTFPLRLTGALLRTCALRTSGSRSTRIADVDLKQVEVVASVAMMNAANVRLRPHSPDSIGYMWDDGERTLPTNNGNWHLSDDVFAGSELAGNPDGCAYRLTRRLYAEFDFPQLLTHGDAVPRQFDRVTGKLVLPE